MRLLKIFGVLVGLLALAVALVVASNWDLVRRTMLGGLKVYETDPPMLPRGLRRPAILVFSKTNGFRHADAIPAGKVLFRQIAQQQGWGYFETENGAAFEPRILANFDLVVFNNASGDLFTNGQRHAFEEFINNGGGFLGIHAAGDSSHQAWPWYVENVIGARFTGHPLSPQFQAGTVRWESDAGMPSQCCQGERERIDEWYFFDQAPTSPPFHIVAWLNEASLTNRKQFWRDLSMSGPHPIAWRRCLGQGRVFYTAMGHKPEAYTDPNDAAFLIAAAEWAMPAGKESCRL